MVKFTKEWWLTHEHPNKGKPMSKEQKQKISNTKTGTRLTVEHRRKMSETHKRLGTGKWMEGRHLTLETRMKISSANTGILRPMSKETKLKMSLAHKGKLHSSEHKQKISKTTKQTWSNPAYKVNQIKAQILGRQISPNRPEQALGRLIRLATGTREYRFNAKHGYIIIDGLVPDFVNVNGQKKCIELFGDYWHDPTRRRLSAQSTEDGRKEIMKRFGWSCLVIWEKELKEPEKVIERIKGFNEEGFI